VPWLFRATDCDVAGHVNNAAYWEPLEDELLRREDPRSLDVEIEFRTPAQPGEKLIVRGGRRRWIVALGGETHATIMVGG
jgi:acyl-ACP thioesterase